MPPHPKKIYVYIKKYKIILGFEIYILKKIHQILDDFFKEYYYYFF